MKKRPTQIQQSQVTARQAALATLRSLFFNERPLFDALESSISRAGLEARDAAFARAIVMTVLRRLGQIDAILSEFLREPLPVRAGSTELILRQACAELVFLDVPAHAAVSSAVDLAGQEQRSSHFKSLVNAVARRIAREGKSLAATQDAEKLNAPEWAWSAWESDYGIEGARAIGRAHATEPPLDISVKSDAAKWAQTLEAVMLPSGTLRRPTGGRIEDLPGYLSGDWWVQDAAAALPARLAGNVSGKLVYDLCAAPGGKTAQLLAAGAEVVAVDLDANRMKRLSGNLQRLKLKAECVVASVLDWKSERRADVVLLDAPCTATGTVRRHPDVLWRKGLSDVMAQADLQLQLLNAASRMVADGGVLIYCVCSLSLEEGDEVIEKFLAESGNSFSRVGIAASELFDQTQLITPSGDLRTLPSHWPELGGLDGFFACRLIKRSSNSASSN